MEPNIKKICRAACAQPGTVPVVEGRGTGDNASGSARVPPGALIPNTCPKYIVEQSFENTKAVGVATVHSAKAIGTTTN